jgi:RimJ/RimL family protein N-acetyltransferase
VTWLPQGFDHPLTVELGDGNHHLRPISPDDTELDMLAVMGSQERLWSIFGEPWGWPPPTMTAEQDREDLERHASEMNSGKSFNYALFDSEDTLLLGCVYIDPPERAGADAEICWWVIDDLVGTQVEARVEAFVPAWIDRDWPFENARYIGLDLSWSEWLALPGL